MFLKWLEISTVLGELVRLESSIIELISILSNAEPYIRLWSKKKNYFYFELWSLNLFKGCLYFLRGIWQNIYASLKFCAGSFLLDFDLKSVVKDKVWSKKFLRQKKLFLVVRFPSQTSPCEGDFRLPKPWSKMSSKIRHKKSPSNNFSLDFAAFVLVLRQRKLFKRKKIHEWNHD